MIAKVCAGPTFLLPIAGRYRGALQLRTADGVRALKVEPSIVDVPWVFRDHVHEYDGVPLDRVLTHLGFNAGPGGPSLLPKDRRPGWRKVVLAKRSDGFVAVFTCAELMPEMGATRAYVVWRCDGQDLPPDEGPLRLIVARGWRSTERRTGAGQVCSLGRSRESGAELLNPAA